MQRQITESYCDMPHRQPRGQEAPVEVEAVASFLLTVEEEGQKPRTVRFDLCEPDQVKFEKAIAPYFEHGQLVKLASVGGTQRRSVRSAPAPAGSTRSFSTEDNRAIREWATEAGYEISPRGRISQSIIEAYVEAGNPAPTPLVAA